MILLSVFNKKIANYIILLINNINIYNINYINLLARINIYYLDK